MKKKIVKIVDLFSGERKNNWVTLIIIVIIISAFGLLLYQEYKNEQTIKINIFNQYKTRQIETTEAIAEQIGSDLTLLSSILQGIADSTHLHHGELYGEKIEEFMEKKFTEINNITKVDGLFIADENNIITSNIVSEGQRSFVNIDISFRDYVEKTRNTSQPFFSNGFQGIDNIFRIAITVPIMNTENGKYMGLIGLQIPIQTFFAHYGNITNVNSQFLVAYDSKWNYIATPRTQFLGENFFSEKVQDFFNVTFTQNEYYRNIFSGKLLGGSAVYDFGSGERLNTGYPIFLNDVTRYFIFIITPTDSIYSHIDKVLGTERLKFISIIIGFTFAVLVLIFFLIKWNSILRSQVRKKTKELLESNKQLSLSNKEIVKANKELKDRAKMQKEFVDIAAHELRTPIQSIVGYIQMIKEFPDKSKEYLESLERNSSRLYKLTQDILDVTRIESKSFNQNLEKTNIVNFVEEILDDFKKNQQLILEKVSKNKDKDAINVNTFFDKSNLIDQDLIVKIDKSRIQQVILNLLLNAYKFSISNPVDIKIAMEVKKEDNEVLISVKDRGRGIDIDILPRLFNKFVTRSFSGVGLGLYIAKNIISSHGGKIFAYNNEDGKGATFQFTLPIVDDENDIIR